MKINLRRSLITIGLSLCLSVSSFAAKKIPDPVGTATPIDRIVAVVNSKVITQVELNRAMLLAKARFRAAKMALPPKSQFRLSVLNGLIDKKLQLQWVPVQSQNVPAKAINDLKARMAKSQGMTVQQWTQHMHDVGYTRQAIQQELKTMFLIQQVRSQVLRDKIRPTPQQLQQLRQVRAQMQGQLIHYHVVDYLFALDSDASTQQRAGAKSRAMHVIDQLRQNKSINPQGIQVNDMGWQTVNELPTLFSQALLNQSSGSVIGPLMAGNGVHVLKLMGVKRKNTHTPSTQELMNALLQRNYQKAVLQWITELRKNAYVKILPAS